MVSAGGLLHLGSAGGAPFFMPADELTRHAVCLGMTGSGKTGLCLALLEEAARLGVPLIAVDPKGDVANLLLTFPALDAASFEPWLDERQARQAGSRAEAAGREAARWREGLTASGVEVERIRQLRDAVELCLFTPGSDAGRSLSLLGGLEAPRGASPEALRERSQTAASALLELAGVEAEAGRSREHALLTAILQQAWGEGRDLDLPALVLATQKPPFATLGVLDLEAYFPAKERFSLVTALNNLLSSPTPLTRGAPLDVAALLQGEGGRPRASVISIAHLAESERRGFVTALLGHLLGWVRSQRGQSGLRALFFMDEVAGYLPPVANPPSKSAFLTLFKQARAQGLGVVVATQNPADLDYKALSNAATWLVGRLQTARDRQRVREALSGVDAPQLPEGRLDALLGGLQTRQFLCHAAWGDPQVFEARWALSYLRGPLSLDELRRLHPAEAAAELPPQAGAPLLPQGVKQVFVPPADAAGPIRYRPVALGVARLRFADKDLGVDEVGEVCLAAPLRSGPLGVDWAQAQRVAVEAASLETTPRGAASFDAIEAGALGAEALKGWQKSFALHLAATEERRWWLCAKAGLTSRPGESDGAFRARIAEALEAAAAVEVAAVKKAWGSKRKAAEERVRRAEQARERRQERAAQAKTKTLLTAGAALLGGLLGGKRSAGRDAARLIQDATRVKHAGNEVERAEEDIQAAKKALAELDAAQTRAEAEARLAFSSDAISLQELRARPARGQIEVLFLGVGWLPSTP